jgi:hypothetical protein
METTNLITNRNDLGFDMFPIYQISCYSFSVPTFEHLYDEYKIAFLQKETHLSEDEIRGQLFLVNQGHYTPHDLGTEELLTCRQQPEFLDYLIANGYSFSLGKEYFNMPLREVW